MSGNRAREAWVDNVKVVACILVVVGHFFQSMRPEMIPQENSLAGWFDRTIYYFHVPLFFICSGYVYQKYGKIDTVRAYLANIKKKIITLGMPYLAFTTITWLLKWVFSGDVNYRLDGLGNVLLVNPTSPYWFLYALFFVFAVTPTAGSKRKGILALAASVFLYFAGYQYGGNIPCFVRYVLLYEVWFVLGMNLCLLGAGRNGHSAGYVCIGLVAGIIFILLSAGLYSNNVQNAIVDLLMGALGCAMTILIVNYCTAKPGGKACSAIVRWTMPVFLMHTIFAAPVRIILLKLNVRNLAVHTVFGLTASFIGPIITAKIAEKFRWLDIWIYPGKYIRS